MKKQLTIILLFLFLFTLLLIAVKPLSAADISGIQTYGVNISKEYEFDLENNLVWMAYIGTVTSTNNQLLLAQDAGSKNITEKKEQSLVKYYKLRLYDIIDKQAKLVWTSPKLNNYENAYACGDLNNDNTNALYIFRADKVDQIKYNGKKFLKKSLAFPVKYPVKQALIGDIDNDGRNELVAFVSDKTKRFTASEKLSLIIYKCSTDKGEFTAAYFGTFSYNGGQDHPDTLLCISDLYNNGQNKLVIKLGRPDIGPAQYKILSYQNDKLYKEKTFDQENNASALDLDNTSPKTDWHNKLMGDLRFLKYNNRTYFLGKMLPQTSAPAATSALTLFTEKRIIINSEMRVLNQDPGIMMPVNFTGKNSELIYLTEKGKATMYKVDNLGEE